MKKGLLFLVMVLVGCQGVTPQPASLATPLPTDTPAPPSPSVSLPTVGPVTAFHSELFKVSLDFPSTWKKMDGYLERYQGWEGFVSLDAKETENPTTLQAVCEDEINHILQPYGSKPVIRYITIDSQEACLIFPSQDQNPTMAGAGEIVVRYPKPVIINGNPYTFLQIVTRQEFMTSLIGTVKFDALDQP